MEKDGIRMLSSPNPCPVKRYFLPEIDEYNSLNTKISDLNISLRTQLNGYEPTVSVSVRIEAYDNQACKSTRLPVSKKILHQARLGWGSISAQSSRRKA